MWLAYCRIEYVTNKTGEMYVYYNKALCLCFCINFLPIFFYAAIIKFGNSEDIARLVYILINMISMYLYIKALITDINYHGIY